MPNEYVLGIGAANVDLSGASAAAVVMRDSNPGAISVSTGGVTRNILENLSRMGGGASIITAVGCDLFGEKILSDSSRAGIDVSGVLRVADMASSSYLSVLDATGDMLVAVSDMHISARITPQYLKGKSELFEGADAVVCDPCLSPETLYEIFCGVGQDKPVVLDPVSTSYARRAREFLPYMHTVKPNLLELSVLAEMEIESERDIREACERLIKKGTKRVVVTMGDEGCRYCDSDGLYLSRRLRPIEKMANATGAGDAFTAGLLFSMLRGFPVEKTLDCALAAGIIALLSVSTINPLMSEQLVYKTIEEYEDKK